MLRTCHLLSLDDIPVKHTIVFEALALKKVSEDALQVSVVRPVLKTQRLAVGEIIAELRREASAELVRVCGLFALQNALVLLLLGGGLEALPGQRAAQKVHQHKAQRFNVVATALFNAQMSVNGGVSSCAR